MRLIYTLLHWAVSAISLLLTAHLVRGFRVRSFLAALIAAVGIGLANVLIWPLLFFLTLPINILTLGLFTFVVNGITLKIAAALLPGFDIETWSAAIFGAIILSLIGTALHFFLI